MNYEDTYLLVEAVFQVQLWRLGLHGLQLDGHVLVVVEVLAQPQLAKVAAADLLAHAKVGAHLGMEESEVVGSSRYIYQNTGSTIREVL